MIDTPPAKKARTGRRFEEFHLGQRFRHPVPRTVTEGDLAVHRALTGGRHALTSADTTAHAFGLERAPAEELIAFHVVLGKSVPDISHDVIANLGFAELRLGVPVFPGDTLTAESTVIGLRQIDRGDAGIIWVRTEGRNQDDLPVIVFYRWCLVPKRDPASPPPEPSVPDFGAEVPVMAMHIPSGLSGRPFDPGLTGCPHLMEDYRVGEVVDHVDGATLEEAEHQMMARLFQVSSRIHADAAHAAGTGHGRRLAYGGHALALARALIVNGLANALWLTAIHRLDHKGPVFGGDTVTAVSQVTALDPLPGRIDLGVIRLTTTVGTVRPAAEPAVAATVDWSFLMPRR